MQQPATVDRLALSANRAVSLRLGATRAEQQMCRILDAAKISYVFQSNMCDRATGRMYIADFRIKRVGRGRVFVEVDGTSHDHRGAYDAARTRWIEANRDAIVLRFTNEDVFQRPEFVVAEIEKQRPAHKTVKTSATGFDRFRASRAKYEARVRRGVK